MIFSDLFGFVIIYFLEFCYFCVNLLKIINVFRNKVLYNIIFYCLILFEINLLLLGVIFINYYNI